VLRANLKWKLVSQLVGSCLAVTIAIGITSCDGSTGTMSNSAMMADGNPALANTDGPLLEVNTPASIAKLAPTLGKFQPQVRILSPQPDQILSDDRVTVKLQVNDLPLFKQPELGLGNHLHVILDEQTYQGVYDLSQPLVFKNLAAGTHSLRVFASRPWHESFKNEGAYAQTTFHVLTKTAVNNPDPQLPLLTYSRPVGTYSAEPIMLDYYLTNVPDRSIEQGSPDRLPDWRIRATVNEQQFILDRWAPIYLQGFKQGKNWVRLELVDDRGNPISNVYNDTLGIVTYDPGTKDTLAKLIGGEIDPDLARTLVDPNYVVVAARPIPAPSVTPIQVNPTIPIAPSTPISPPILTTPILIPPPVVRSQPSPSPAIQPEPIAIATPPVVKPSPIPVSSPAPIVITPPPVVKSIPTQVPEPIAVTPSPLSNPSPIPVVTPPPIVNPNPSPVLAPAPIVKPNPSYIVEPIAPQPVQPLISPAPTAAPVVSQPAPAPAIERPIPVSQPSPVAVPTPEVASSPILSARDYSHDSSPQISTPHPAPSYLPTPTPTVTPQILVVDKSPQPRQIPVPTITPTTPAAQIEQIENKAEKTWQTQSIELLNITRAKIRAFTNTIPAKAQRFGANVCVWTGYALDYASDRIQEWRNQHQS
jgi:hypothetical protein